jgi:hypothetical protein
MPDKKPKPASKDQDPIKNPEGDLEHPASMPRDQQGKGAKAPDRDPAGRQGGYH